jgi:hypothetical protein
MLQVFGTAGNDPRQRFALRQRLEDIVQARMGLAARLVEIKSSSITPQQKQQEINREVNALVLQTRGAVQVGAVVSIKQPQQQQQQSSVPDMFSMSCRPAVMSLFPPKSHPARPTKQVHMPPGYACKHF